MNNANVWQRIQRFNHGRDPDRLAMKYRAMQKDSFTFFRATAHLFYEDWPQDALLNSAPLAWICGDLHLENFGSYKGDNRLSYFDINDFDEAVLAPCTWDLARFLCSLLLADETLVVNQDVTLDLCKNFLRVYAEELTVCKARWIERATASGMIRDLLKSLKHRARSDLLKERTLKQHGNRVIKLDGKKALPAKEEDKQKVRTLLASFASGYADAEHFQVLDVARRIAGVSSLGLERYVVLVLDRRNEKHYLLDLKHQPGSSLKPYLTLAQPKWASEAERVVRLQQRGQAIAPAFLSAIGDGKRSYVLKELMPHQDRLNLNDSQGQLSRLETVIRSMAELAAWLHIRTGGWQGSAAADQWQQFGEESTWQAPLLDYALDYSRKVRSDWLSFKADIG